MKRIDVARIKDKLQDYQRKRLRYFSNCIRLIENFYNDQILMRKIL